MSRVVASWRDPTDDVQRFDPKTFRYQSRRPDQIALEKRIKEICETCVRYGYRRVHVLLQREGWDVNHKKVRWIYNELGLQLRNKTPKRRVICICVAQLGQGTRIDMAYVRRDPSDGSLDSAQNMWV